MDARSEPGGRMAETHAIVGVYGAIDRAVQNDPQARASVATLLDQYKDPRFHWFDEFQKWRRISEPGSAEPPHAQLERALSHLGDLQPSHARVRARRMFAVGVATRAFAGLQKPQSKLAKLAVNALHPDSLDVAKPKKAAQEVYKLLRSDETPQSEDAEPGPSSWWDGVVEAAVEESLLPGPPSMHPRPCSGELVTVPGQDGPAAALTTEFDTKEISFDAATRLLDPLNWRECIPNFWCEVRAIGEPAPGERCYHEVVSSDCEAGADAWFSAETDLLFNFIWLPSKKGAEAALANYQLAPGRPLPNDLIRVDEGTLLVAKVDGDDNHLRITTTKRIRFNYPFSSEMLAMMMCALGYANVGAHLASCAAKRGRDPMDSAGPPLSEFPGVSHTAAMAAGTWPGGRRAGTGSPGRVAQTNLGALMQDAADIWARTLRDGAAAVERGAGRHSRAQRRQRD